MISLDRNKNFLVPCTDEVYTNSAYSSHIKRNRR